MSLNSRLRSGGGNHESILQTLRWQARLRGKVLCSLRGRGVGAIRRSDANAEAARRSVE